MMHMKPREHCARGTGAALVTLALLCGAPAPAPAQQGTGEDRLVPTATPSIWERLRDEMHAVRGPDPVELRNLRYLSRYAVSPQLADQIRRAAEAEGIDPEIGFRLVWVESRFQPRARGPRGALGLMQLMPGTARALDPSLRTESDILNPDNNLRLGFRYFRQLLDKYDGDVRLALLAYNRGPGTVDRHLRQGRDPENGYSRKVLGTGSQRYQGSARVERVR
jgi:soluble lytic murein transglycosylase-like protein